MDICHISNYLPGYHNICGGAEQACYRLIKLLIKHNCKISVLSSLPNKAPDTPPEFNLYPLKTLEDYLGDFRIRSVKRLWLPYDPVVSYQFKKLLKQIKPDIIHLHNVCVVSFSILPICKIYKIPVVMSIYDYWCVCPNEMLLNGNHEICKKFHGIRCINCVSKRYELNKLECLAVSPLMLRKVFFDFFIDMVDAFIVLSESSHKILNSYGINENRIHVIRQIFDFNNDIIENNTDIEKYSIVYTGWVQHRKGLHVIIEALPEILKFFPETKLYVLGFYSEPKYIGEIRIKVKKLGLNDNVHFSGRLSKIEFENFLKKANVVVIPEQWENMSPVILTEAMFYGKPIVASKIGGIPEFVEDGVTGLLAEPNNPKEFAEKIAWIFQNEKPALEMGMKAKKSAKEMFNRKQSINQILDLYTKLVRKQ